MFHKKPSTTSILHMIAPRARIANNAMACVRCNPAWGRNARDQQAPILFRPKHVVDLRTRYDFYSTKWTGLITV